MPIKKAVGSSAVGRWIYFVAAVFLLSTSAVEAGDSEKPLVTKKSWPGSSIKPVMTLKNSRLGCVHGISSRGDNRQSVPWRNYDSVLRVQTSRGYCTGVLFLEKYVLTAGHCIDGLSGRDVTVKTANGDSLPAKRLYLSPEYSGPEGYFIEEISSDISVIELHAPLRNIRPASVVFGFDDSAETGELIAFHCDDPERLKRERCKIELIDSELEEDMIKAYCTFIATGASGAPLFAKDADGRNVVIGILSSKKFAVGYAAYLGAHDETTKFLKKFMASSRSSDSRRGGGDHDLKMELYILNRRF